MFQNCKKQYEADNFKNEYIRSVMVLGAQLGSFWEVLEPNIGTRISKTMEQFLERFWNRLWTHKYPKWIQKGTTN